MTTYLGKSCSFGLPRVPFVNCRRFMYLVISLLVYRAGCGIWLYQFLIIAYLFTLGILTKVCEDYFLKNKEFVKWMSTILMHVMRHFKSKQFLCERISLHATSDNLFHMWCIQSLCSPLCWKHFTNYIFSISLANDFLLTIAIWPLVGYKFLKPRFHLRRNI